MAPKKKPETPREDRPDGLIVQQQRQASVLAVEEGEAIAVDVMRTVVQRAGALMVSNYVDRISIPYTVQDVAKEMLDLIQFMFIARDNGDGDLPDDAAAWAADEEPGSVAPDSWARGAVPTRRRAPIPAADHPDAQTPLLLSPKRRRATLQDPPKGADTKVAGKDRDREAPASTEVPKPGGTSPAKGKGAPLGVAPALGSSKDDIGLTQLSTVVDDGLVEAQRALRQSQMEQQRRMEAQERVEAQMKALKQAGRDFFVDSTAGRVIPVQSVDVKRLPTRVPEVRVRIEGNDSEEEEPAKEEPRRRGLAFSPPRPEKGKKKREARVPPGTFLHPEDSSGPMVEEIRPVGGVTFREGDRVQRTDLKAPKDRPSKADFRREQESQGLSMDFVLAQEEMKKSIEAVKKAAASKSLPPPLASQGGGTSPKTEVPGPAPGPGRKGGPAPAEGYRPQEVAALPGQKEPTGYRSRNPRDRAAKGASEPRSPEKSGRHWTAGAFTAAGSPVASPHLPGLPASASSTIRNTALAQDFLQALQAPHAP